MLCVCVSNINWTDRSIQADCFSILFLFRIFIRLVFGFSVVIKKSSTTCCFYCVENLKNLLRQAIYCFFLFCFVCVHDLNVFFVVLLFFPFHSWWNSECSCFRSNYPCEIYTTERCQPLDSTRFDWSDNNFGNSTVLNQNVSSDFLWPYTWHVFM